MVNYDTKSSEQELFKCKIKCAKAAYLGCVNKQKAMYCCAPS